jgi:VIT1/CCC1 family predicted Fe2+/Mn2+ transporter
LFFVGLVKGEVVRKHPIKAAIETLIIGGIAAILAFVVGYLLKGLA